VNNRGNKLALWTFNGVRGNKLALWTFNGVRGNNPASLVHAGNGFLMREGYSILWCGWNGDVVPGDDRLLVGLPVARDNGRPITGPIHVEICRDERVDCQPLYWGPWGIAAPYAPVSLDSKAATLTVRARRSESGVSIPPDGWAFGRLEGGKLIADPGAIWVRDGIRPGWLYDLVYVGRDPRVVGLGLAAIRDCTSFFRYDATDHQGNANPLAGAIERAYAFGISQSGRAVRHFLFAEFNADERQRLVFDAALAHVAGSGRLFTQRFGVLTVCAGHHENLLTPTEQFPFTTVPQTDPLTGRHGDLLARSRCHMPKIVFTQTSTEYWTRAASLTHTDVDGRQDVGLDPNAFVLHCGRPAPGRRPSRSRHLPESAQPAGRPRSHAACPAGGAGSLGDCRPTTAGKPLPANCRRDLDRLAGPVQALSANPRREPAERPLSAVPAGLRAAMGNGRHCRHRSAAHGSGVSNPGPGGRCRRQ